MKTNVKRIKNAGKGRVPFIISDEKDNCGEDGEKPAYTLAPLRCFQHVIHSKEDVPGDDIL
jgi:hypothetical protein